MPEAKEGEPVPFEGWVLLTKEIQEFRNQMTVDSGAINMECLPFGLLLENSPINRVNQVIVALKYAVGNEAATRTMAGALNTSLGFGAYSVGENSVVVSFNRGKKSTEGEGIRDVNTILKQANEILETFDQPKIPAFTTKTSGTV